MPGREASSKLKAQAVIRGCNKIGYQVFNVGKYDLAAGYEFLKSLADSSDCEFISANIIDAVSQERVFKPSIILAQGGIKVGIVGLTTELPRAVNGLAVKDFLETGQEEIKALKAKADIVVVLLNAARVDVAKAKDAFIDADYIFVSRETSRTRPEAPQEEGKAMFYSMNIQGKYIARLDIAIKKEGDPIHDITGAIMAMENLSKRMANLQKRDPGKSLDEIYKDNPNVLEMINKYRNKLSESETTLGNAINTSFYSLLPLNKNIASEQTLLAYVDATLKSCSDLDQRVKRNL